MNYCNKKGECTAEIDDTECDHYESCNCSEDCDMCAFWDVYHDGPTLEPCLNEEARKAAGAPLIKRTPTTGGEE